MCGGTMLPHDSEIVSARDNAGMAAASCGLRRTDGGGDCRNSSFQSRYFCFKAGTEFRR